MQTKEVSLSTDGRYLCPCGEKFLTRNQLFNHYRKEQLKMEKAWMSKTRGNTGEE